MKPKCHTQVDLVNAIFTSLDKAADLIGSVWKVETIGDCYQVVSPPYSARRPVQSRARFSTFDDLISTSLDPISTPGRS